MRSTSSLKSYPLPLPGPKTRTETGSLCRQPLLANLSSITAIPGTLLSRRTRLQMVSLFAGFLRFIIESGDFSWIFGYQAPWFCQMSTTLFSILSIIRQELLLRYVDKQQGKKEQLCFETCLPYVEWPCGIILEEVHVYFCCLLIYLGFHINCWETISASSNYYIGFVSFL